MRLLKTFIGIGTGLAMLGVVTSVGIAKSMSGSKSTPCGDGYQILTLDHKGGNSKFWDPVHDEPKNSIVDDSWLCTSADSGPLAVYCPPYQGNKGKLIQLDKMPVVKCVTEGSK